MAKKKIQPLLRFKDDKGNDFPDWEEKVFGEVLSFQPTNSFSRSQLNYSSGTVKNIHYGDIHTKFKTTFIVVNEDVPYINEDINVEKISEDSFCKPGDIVIADASEDYNDIGKTIEIIDTNDEKIVAGLHTYLARDKQEMAIGFKGYLMQSHNVREQMMTLATGISVLGISKTNLGKVKLNVPCVEEQKKIAGFLSAIDSKIEKLEKELEELKAYKKGVMQAIFDFDADAEAKRSEAKRSEAKRIKIEALQGTKRTCFFIRFKDEKGNDYPDWEIKKLDDITVVYDGTHLTPDYKQTGVPFYSVEQITSDNFNDTKFVSEEIYEKECKRVKIEKGDILLTRIGDIGTSKYVSWDVRASFYVSLALIKKPSFHSSKYLDQYFKSCHFQKELHKRTLHVAFPKKINLGEIGQCIVLLPCLEEQNKIANFLTAIDDKTLCSKKQLENIHQYKQALLQQLFN